MRVARKWLYWLFPPLFCVYVYWYALNGWFQQDDFVWLGLLRDVHGARDLGLALFKPTIHGTWRPWSDRAFLPVFRIWPTARKPLHTVAALYERLLPQGIYRGRL